MKTKVVLIAGLSVLWGYLMASQFGLVQAGSLGSPITYPTPITYPITYPTPCPTKSPHPIPTITPIPSIKPTPSPKPIPQFIVGGRVTYRISFWRRDILIPASNVTITLLNKETGEKLTTRTGWDGSYKIFVKAGKYTVRPLSLVRWVKFVPTSREIKIVGKGVNGIDFVGTPVFGNFMSDSEVAQ